MSKTVIVTGANGNLGTATIKTMLDKGYWVIAVGNSGTISGLPGHTKNYEYRTANLMNEDEVNHFIEYDIIRSSSIDAALLLVGGFKTGNIENTSGEDLKRMFSLNFETAYYMARPLLRHMLDNSYGRIVLVGARQALQSNYGKDAVAYTLSKTLLFKLAELLNEESKGKNVVTSVIVPGTIDTPQNRESMPEANPETWVKAEQIAAVLDFICSDNSFPIREPIFKIYNNA